jgi:hypothetical protein
MKILIISAAFYPANSPRSFRTTELVKEFSRQGHDITLITPYNKAYHPEFEIEWNIRILDPGVPSLPDFNSNNKWLNKFLYLIRRGLEIVIEYPDIRYYSWAKKAIRDQAGYDILISIAAPHPVHWGVSANFNSNNTQKAKIWIADCGDPFMGARMSKIRKMPWFSFFEKRFCQKADYITVPVESAKEAYYSEFRNKIRVIPQGFKFEDTFKLRSEYKPNEIISFAYAGSLSPGMRDPRPLLKYLSTVKIPYKFIIFTNAPNLVKEYADNSGGKIECRTYVPRYDLIPFLSKMDFLINFENEVNEQVPSKLIDYHLMGRPILSIHAGSDLPEVVLPFLKGIYTKAWKIQNVDNYKIENVVENFLDLYQDGIQR